MREIKFRAWDGEKLRYPNLINTSDSPTPFTCYTTDNLEPGHFDAKELMQFTGLKDLQGKEIYEGDIVDYGNGRNKVVEFIDGCFCICGITAMPKLMTLYPVIGNIYENPELLK